MKFNFFKKNEIITPPPAAEKEIDNGLPWGNVPIIRPLSVSPGKEKSNNELPWDMPVVNNVKAQKIEESKSNSFEFLKGFCETVEKYFERCDFILKDIYQSASEIKILYPEKAQIINQLLNKFDEKIKQNKNRIEYWRKNIVEIKNTGRTDDPDIRTIINIPTEEEQLKEFKRIIFTDLSTKYYDDGNMTREDTFPGKILVLAEEFRNIHYFINKEQKTVENIENKCEKLIEEFLDKSKNMIGINLYYAPLFNNYEKYAATTKLIDKKIDSVYDNISGLKRDDIREIFSYGFEEDFSYRSEQTMVSLA